MTQPSAPAFSRLSAGTSKASLLPHVALSVFFLLFYLLLNRPEIILVSKLGFTTWYPATGLIFALMLGISPWYAILVCVADSLAGALLYHQPVFSFSGLAAPVFASGFYGLAAVVLRNRLPIHLGLARGVDVLRYTVVTLLAAIGSTACGVLALVLDHTIALSDYWRSAAGWFIGDEVALLAVAPFLLIHVLPAVRKKLYSRPVSATPPSPRSELTVASLAEGLGQIIAILGVLWIMFGQLFAPYELFYLCFVPIVWVAMRNGIRRVVVAILALDFGIVAALHFFPANPSVVAKVGLLMLVVSATGMILGSAVSERQHIRGELNQRTVYLNSLTENSPFGIVVLDRAGRVELCNLAFENLFGFSRAELVGNKLASLIPDPEPGSPLELSPQLYNGKSIHGDTRRIRRDGTPIHVEIRAVPLIIDGQVRGSYALYEDISGAVKAAHEKAEQQNLLHGVVSELQSRTDEMTQLIDLSGLLQCCAGLDEAYTIITQFGVKLFSQRSSGSLSIFKSSRNLLELASSWGPASDAPPTFAPESCWALRRGKPHWSRNTADGLICPHLKSHLGSEHALCVPMVAQGDTIGVLQLHLAADAEPNSTEQNNETALERIASSAAGQIALSIASLRLRAALKDQSIRDPLTGLYNRRFMQEYLDRELPRARRSNRSLAVVFVDLDHFKRFNDSFGHEAGDSVLQVFAKALTTHFRDSDVICRYGGEEFALVLPDSPSVQAEIRVNALREEIKKMSFTHRDTKLGSVTLSAGIASFPTNGHTAEELFRVADRCLYESKRQGRDRVTLPQQDPAPELTTASNSKSST